MLDHVTSPDGINFKTIGFDEDGEVHFDNSATSGWTEFKLWFRSPEKDVKVYMLKNTTVTSTGIDWVADAAFKLTKDENSTTEVGKTYTLYGANAVRISTTENKVTPDSTSESGFSYDDGESAKVFELGYKDKGDQKLDTEIKTDYGSVAYYNTKNQNNPITINPNNPPTLPEVYGYENLPELKDLNTPDIKDTHVPVATLEAESNISGTTLYYGQITVRIWLEGWDPDMFNAIMADKIQIHLFFGGLSPSSLLSTGDVSSLALEVNGIQSFTVTVKGYTGEISVESSDPNVAKAEATIDQNQETKQVTVTVTVTAVGEGEAKITISLGEEYPGVKKEIPVTVSNPSNPSNP